MVHFDEQPFCLSNGIFAGFVTMGENLLCSSNFNIGQLKINLLCLKSGAESFCRDIRPVVERMKN